MDVNRRKTFFHCRRNASFQVTSIYSNKFISTSLRVESKISETTFHLFSSYSEAFKVPMAFGDLLFFGE